MSNPHSKDLETLIAYIRKSFHLLKTRSEQLLVDLDVNPSMRAILETLYKDGPKTVPDIARQKSVSRQHIQIIVNSLSDVSLVKQVENPAHKRSPKFCLTDKGRSTFEEALRKEGEPLREMTGVLPLEDLPTSIKVLKRLNEELTNQIEKGNKQ